MNIDMEGLIDTTVTVFSRVSAKDAGTELIGYKVLTVSPAFWNETYSKTTDADGVVHRIRSVKVQIPASSATYVPYYRYVKEAAGTDVEGVYTLSLQDYILKGNTTLQGTVDLSTVIQEVSNKPHCVVSAFRDCTNNDAVEHGLEGCMKYASMVYVEGM